jgi:hypothetical protein
MSTRALYIPANDRLREKPLKILHFPLDDHDRLSDERLSPLDDHDRLKKNIINTILIPLGDHSRWI